ncbi:DUF7009 family protein [Halpernia sp. GG3]
MKIRIKGNSIRLRLTKTDVQNLKKSGFVEETTIIGNQQVFKYALVIDANKPQISASFNENKITLYISKKEAFTITDTDEITLEGFQKNDEENDLFLLVEKDLECLDTTFEDQSDMYKNTKTTC